MAGVTGNTGTIVRVVDLLVVVGIEGVEATTVDKAVVREVGCSALSGAEWSTEDLEGRSMVEAVALASLFPGTIDDTLVFSSVFSSGSAPVCWLAGSSTDAVTSIFRRLRLHLGVRRGKGSSGWESQGSVILLNSGAGGSASGWEGEVSCVCGVIGDDGVVAAWGECMEADV
jgi:hypothetical protein